MEETIKTGRALQLEGLENARNKVTLGFKCEAGTKIQLAREAAQSGMTLSEYVDTVISSRHDKPKVNPVYPPYPELNKKLGQQREQITLLEKKVEFYENDFMKKAFNQYKGQRLEFVDANKKTQVITINRIEDVFMVLINTVKIN